MRNNNSTIYALDNDTGKFKKGDIELTVIKINGEHIGENPIEAERNSKTLLQTKPYTFTASLFCLRKRLLKSFTFCFPILVLELFIEEQPQEKSLFIREGSFKPFLYQCRWSLLCLNSIKWD